MDLSTCVLSGMNSVLFAMTGDIVTEAKDEQVEAVTNIICGKDTVCVLPTGYGKSMILMCLPPLYHHISQHAEMKLKKTDRPLVLIISPLLSLMSAHVKEATDLHLVAYQLPTNSTVNLESADLLFASPEYWTSKEGTTMLQAVSHRVIVTVTDEVHVAPKW